MTYLVPAIYMLMLLSMIGLYAAAALASRQEKRPPQRDAARAAASGKRKKNGEAEDAGGLDRGLTLTASYLYDRVFSRFEKLKPESVRRGLITLTPQVKIERAERAYYTGKLKLAYVLVFAGLVLALLSWFRGRGEQVLEGDHIDRMETGGGARDAMLIAQTEEGKVVGEYEIRVEERRLDEAQCRELYEALSGELPSIILGENTSADNITGPLRLPKRVPGYPFTLRYDSSNYRLMYTDGRPVTEEIPKEGAEVMLRVSYRYADLRYEQDIALRLVPPESAAEKSMDEEVSEALAGAHEDSLYEERMTLPGQVGEQRLTWKERIGDNSRMILLLLILMAAMTYVAKDYDLKRKLQTREEALLTDYPQFVMKLALYLSAGMTVRSVFLRMSAAYEQRKREGASPEYLQEELQRASRELESGVSEYTVYEHFGQRTRLQCYTRLSALLVQNLRKGSAELLPLLKQEANAAITEQLDHARTRGEQASTKLMFPMTLMLFVVMVLVMVPAYMSF